MKYKKNEHPRSRADTQLMQVEYNTEWNEIQHEFVPRVEGAISLAKSYARLNMAVERIDRVISCGNYLEFRQGIKSDGVLSDSVELHRANFCRDRLCPMCQWRRSRKMYAELMQIGKY